MPSQVLDTIKTSDETLLNLGMEWVKYMLFGIQIKLEL